MQTTKNNYTDTTNVIGLNADTQFRFIGIDVDDNKAVVEMSWKESNQRKYRTETFIAHMTTDVKRYLTEVRPVKEEHGMSAEMATGFQVFKHKNNISKNLDEIVFSCKNNSENYADNPFRLFVNKEGKASLYMVGSPNLSVKQIIDPITNNVVRTIFYKKRNHEGNYFFLAPKFYRRFVVRPKKK